MNKKELEEMFYNKFIGDNLYEVKQFIFETIIPEVLNSVIPNKTVALDNNIDSISKEIGYNICIDKIKQDAKEFYNINL